MIERTETDPTMADFHFSDIPAIAKESAEHGLHEIVIWFWNHRPNWMPLEVRQELGTKEEYLEAVKAARAMGVNICPFYTVCLIRPSIASERYGLDLKAAGNFTYHTEFVPVFRPFYMRQMPHINQHPLVSLGAMIPFTNKPWQDDIFATFKDWIDAGVPSVAWDVFRTNDCDSNGPVLVQLIQKVRDYTREKYPVSTFAAELIAMAGLEGGNVEWDNKVLDYTWNWTDYTVTEPILNVLDVPRINMGINTSPKQVRKGFAAGLFLNVFPKKPNRPNGSAMITDYPMLSAALKEVVELRKQFLPFFVDGAALGDSALTEPSSGFVRIYQLPDKLLFIMLNEKQAPQQIDIASDLTLWLPKMQAYQVNYYNSAGKLFRRDFCEKPSTWSASTRQLDSAELALIEVIAVPAESDIIKKYTINGWTIELDSKSAALVKLSHPEVGDIVSAAPDSAGLIDIAYPITEFPPLRLASRFSGAQIEETDKSIRILYNPLGMSRNHFSVSPIDITAEVTIEASDDNKSLIIRSQITNNAQLPVPQILFPDFWGLQPVAGRQETALAFDEETAYPFRSSAFNPDSAAFYASGSSWKTYKPAFDANDNEQSIEIKGPKNNFRITRKAALAQTRENLPTVLTCRDETDDLFLRLCWQHQSEILPGNTWQSGEIKIKVDE